MFQQNIVFQIIVFFSWLYGAMVFLFITFLFKFKAQWQSNFEKYRSCMSSHTKSEMDYLRYHQIPQRMINFVLFGILLDIFQICNYNMFSLTLNQNAIWYALIIRGIVITIYVCKLKDENSKICKPEILIVTTVVCCAIYYFLVKKVINASNQGEYNFQKNEFHIMDWIIYHFEIFSLPLLLVQTIRFFKQIKTENTEELELRKLKIYLRNKLFEI